MIAHIQGIVSEKFANAIIVDVQGVGYEVAVALGDFEKALMGDRIKFFTYHHIREQSQELFGFSSLAAKKIFELLITVQGVGPKAALAILSLADSETVRNAIAGSDTAFITRASGVGKKTAERVVVDLSDKVGLPTSLPAGGDEGGGGAVAANDEALEALMALGFGFNDATTALSEVPRDLPTAERVTRALRA